MSLKKISLSLALVACLTSLASAAPYVVYSGTLAGGSFTASGSARNTKLIFLIADVADTSSYVVMQVDPITKVGALVGYPLANPTTDESNTNFFGGVAATPAAPGLAVFTSSGEETDAVGNIFIARAYGTGAVNVKAFTLVPARTREIDVQTRANGVNGSIFVLAPMPAITVASGSIPSTISGTVFDYMIAPTGSLTQASTSGAFTLREFAALTEFANDGAAITHGRTTTTALPAVGTYSDATSTGKMFEWLYQYGVAMGYTLPALADSTSVAVSGGTLSLNGNSYSGTTVSGTGTLILSGTNTYTGVTTISSGTVIVTGSLTPTTVTVLGTGTTTGTTTTTGSVTLGTGTTTSTGSLTITGGTTTTGSLTLTGTGTTTVGNVLANNASFTITTGTFTIAAVNNGLVDGTITTSALNPISVTGATLIVNSVNTGLTASPGDVVIGTVSLKSGSMTLESGTYTDADSTITITTP